MKRRALMILTLCMTCLWSAAAVSADKVRAASSFRGLWDTTLAEFGKEKAIFSSDGIDLDIAYLQGGGADVLQSVIAGGADIGLGVGSAAAMTAIAKGAPVVIVGATFTGSSDVFFYARANSPVAAFKDLNGRKLGIAHPGSTTQTIVSLLAAQQNIKINIAYTGGPPATMAQVLTGQIDAGWSAFPIGMDKVTSGELRIIASGNDAPGVATETARVIVAGRAFAQKSEAVLQRFFKSYGKVLDWAYSTDDALQKYAALHKISLAVARDIVKKGYPREALVTSRVNISDLTLAEMVRNKMTDKPLTTQQVADMLRLVPVVHK